MSIPLAPTLAQLPPDLAWAAYLVSSWWQAAEPAPATPAAPAAVIDLLRRNGLPLLTLAADPRPAAAEFLSARPCQAAIAEQREKLARQQAAFGAIQAHWAAAGIPAMFVKALGPPPTFPYISNNLDILVPQAQQAAARKIVRDLGYVELRHIEEPNKFLFRRYHLGTSAFDLHIHGRLEWHMEFLDTPAIWARGVMMPDCALAATPAPEDGLLIALAHAIYENKALKLIELAKLIYAARRLDVDWERVADGARRRGWEPGLWFALALCDRLEHQLYGTASLPAEVQASIERTLRPWLRAAVAALCAGPARMPVRIGFLRSKRLYYEKLLADPSEARFERARDVVWHTLYGTRVKLKLHSQRPLLIALDGVDGSGKSAQAALFGRALDEAALRHRLVWTRGGSSAVLQPLLRLGKRLLGRVAGSVSNVGPVANRSYSSAIARAVAVREAERSALFRHPLARAWWPWLVALELGASYLIRVRWPLWRGEVVVVDRYLLSALMELGARLGRPDMAQTPAARLLRWLAPRPDVAYWLDVPVAVALARKEGREAPEFLRQQAALLPALAAEMGAVRLDGTAPVAELSDRMISETLRGYLDTHRTLLNGLFWANPRPLPREWLAEEVSPAGEPTL